MAWKVVNHMEGKEGNARYPHRDKPVYGPLPVKVWVREGKRHKLSYRTPKASTGNGPSGIKDFTKPRAIAYAEWLAKRDGLAIPTDCTVSVCWSGVKVQGKVMPEPRAYAVEWYKQEWKGLREGHVTVCALTISIPHWDWVPQMTEQHEMELAAS